MNVTCNSAAAQPSDQTRNIVLHLQNNSQVRTKETGINLQKQNTDTNSEEYELNHQNDHQNTSKQTTTIDKTTNSNNKPACNLITFRGGPQSGQVTGKKSKTFNGDAPSGRDKPPIDRNSLESIHSKFSTSSVNDVTNTTATSSPVEALEAADDDEAGDVNNNLSSPNGHHCCPSAGVVRRDVALVATRYVSPPKVDETWVSTGDDLTTINETSDGLQMADFDGANKVEGNIKSNKGDKEKDAGHRQKEITPVEGKKEKANEHSSTIQSYKPGRGSPDAKTSTTPRSSLSSNASNTTTGQQQPFKPIKRKGPFPFAGIVASIVGSLCFSTSVLMIKLYPDDTTGLAEKNKLLFVRGTVLTLLCGITILLQRSKFTIPRDEILVNFLRALFGFIGVFGAYVALKYISMGDSTALVFSSPVWTSLLSHFILGEPLHWIILLALPVSMFGILLIAHPSLIVNIEHASGDAERQPTIQLLLANQSHLPPGAESLMNSTLSLVDYANSTLANNNNSTSVLNPINFDIDSATMASEPYDLEHRWPGIVIALFTSLMVSCVYIVLKFRKTTPIQTTTFWLGVFTMSTCGIVMIFTGFGRIPASPYEWFLMSGNGATSWMGQCLIQWALMHEDASILSVVRTMDVAITFVLSALFLEEEILWTSIVGATIISLVVVSIVLDNWIRSMLRSRASILQVGEDDEEGRQVSSKKPDDLNFHQDTKKARQLGSVYSKGSLRGTSAIAAPVPDQLTSAAA